MLVLYLQCLSCRFKSLPLWINLHFTYLTLLACPHPSFTDLCLLVCFTLMLTPYSQAYSLLLSTLTYSPADDLVHRHFVTCYWLFLNFGRLVWLNLGLTDWFLFWHCCLECSSSLLYAWDDLFGCRVIGIYWSSSQKSKKLTFKLLFAIYSMHLYFWWGSLSKKSSNRQLQVQDSYIIGTVVPRYKHIIKFLKSYAYNGVFDICKISMKSVVD